MIHPTPQEKAMIEIGPYTIPPQWRYIGEETTRELADAKENGGKINFAFGPRGLLSNYPDDVVCVVNGKPITKSDILYAKRERQRMELAAKRCSSYDSIIKPCFVWTFYNSGLVYGGWWLYVRTLKESWEIDLRRQGEMVLKIMRLFPCGYLPIFENFTPWLAAFAKEYHYPTRKRPVRQGMAVARAVALNDRLVDVIKWEVRYRRS